MIEVKELKKVYKTKGGVDVHALDGISIKFPEKGMVFLLGKSGSGKSTLLNVTGGLDAPDSGEIIVKGRSSLNFTPADFDSYRNTFVGFIFQEYNVLNDFTIEQNIAVALQLQGKPNDKKAVNEILDKVDLHGLGKRKPNTLSGGQKQRVAIARALIKNPDIIMADEPTGALDSNTGKQVLDTLKKLSEEKLVIVVSHDKEFAKQYADRIIELKDGKVVSDQTRELIIIAEQEENVVIKEDTISIKKGSDLSDEEINKIVCAIKKNDGEVVIAGGKDKLDNVKKAAKIEYGTKREEFNQTKDINSKEYDGSKTHFIKSKLPVRHAFKIGVGSLKVKPIRLAFTILLSVIAFVLFGVLSTMMMYNPIYSIAEALEDSAYTSISLTKTYEVQRNYHGIDEYGNINSSIEYSEILPIYYTLFGQEEIDKLNDNQLGLEFAGVFSCGDTQYTTDDIMNYNMSSGLSIGFQNSDLSVSKDYQHYFLARRFSGFSDCGPEYMERQGFDLYGKYPENKNEIAISEYVYRLLLHGTGFTPSDADGDGEPDYHKYYQNIIGKKIKVDEKIQNLTITGIYQMKIPKKYEALKVSYSLKNLTDELQALREEFESIIVDSFQTIGFVTEDFYNEYYSAYYEIPSDTRMGVRIDYRLSEIEKEVGIKSQARTFSEKDVKKYKDSFIFFDLQGNKSEFSLNDKEIYLSAYVLLNDSTYINKFIATETYKANSGIGGKYFNFAQALAKFRSVDHSYHDNDVQVIMQTLISDYATVVGQSLADFSTGYIKNNQMQEPEKAVVKGFYFLKSQKFTNVYIVNYDYMNQFAQSSIERDKYVLQADKENYKQYYLSYSTDYELPANAKYDKVITKTDNTKKQTYFMLENPPEFTRYHMTNSLYEYAESKSDQVADLSLIFLGAGLAAGLLASLMFLNFISVSIAAKRKEIGVLRAVGARGSDVFKIFFAEALVIALICFVLAAILSGYACMIINTMMMESEIMIKMFNYNVWNVLIVFGVSMIVSFIATIIPVRSAAKKPPVDSIREL